MPLSSRVDQQLWGPTHGSTFLDQWVPKFREASEIFSNQADSKALSTHVPALDRHAPDCARVLDKARTLFALACKPADEKEAGALPPPKAKAKAFSKDAAAPRSLVLTQVKKEAGKETGACLLYTSPSPRDS